MKNILLTLLLSSTLSMGLGLTLTACGGESESSGCGSDTDCDAGFFCQNDTGDCKCRTDDACDQGYYCNSFGDCQSRPPCLGNMDCLADQICNSADPSGGRCIPNTECGSSVHCDLNNFCNPTTNLCEGGCRNTGDCQLGHICIAGHCEAGGTATNCTMCPTYPDIDPSYCDYGEVCNSTGQCVSHTLQSGLCSECGGGGLFPIPCPTDDYICLTDDYIADGSSYCAPICKVDADCPAGYEGCGGTILYTEDCTSTGTCSNGAPCLGFSEQTMKICGCLTDADCGGVDTSCTDMFGSKICANTGWGCDTDEDCGVVCEQIPMGDGTTAGACITARGACGKAAGVSCDELTTGTAECRDY
ncbi:hypothetical protein KAI87_09465 [Myxococcota bacterium]|nr:hypothetical protein [Myxococcota bacterium]